MAELAREEIDTLSAAVEEQVGRVGQVGEVGQGGWESSRGGARWETRRGGEARPAATLRPLPAALLPTLSTPRRAQRAPALMQRGVE